MSLKIALMFLFMLTVMAPRDTMAEQPATEASPLADRVKDTGFLQLYSSSFTDLPPAEKILAYWLSMAAIAVNPIVYDQNSSYGLQEKALLEQILTHSKGIDPVLLKKITDYTKLFWANRGNRNSSTSKKFLPDFTFQELQTAAGEALKNGAQLGSRPSPCQRSPAPVVSIALTKSAGAL